MCIIINFCNFGRITLKLENQIESIWRAVKGFHIIHFIYTGHELDLFNTILASGDEGITSKLLSHNKSLHYSYIDKWCKSGIAWNILENKGNNKVYNNCIVSKLSKAEKCRQTLEFQVLVTKKKSLLLLYKLKNYTVQKL